MSKMNARHILFVLLIFVSITTLTMIMMSTNMATLQIKAYKLFTFHTNTNSANISTAENGTLTPQNASRTFTNPQASSQNSSTSSHNLLTTRRPDKAAEQATNRPLYCKNCFFSNFTNLTAMPEVCDGSGSTTPPEMLMLITTSLNGSERRQAIRDTWASVTKTNTAHIRHVFLLGTDKSRKVSDAIKAESLRHKDMLVSDFVDSYGNLTYKTLVGLHYFVHHCKQAKYFFKTDEDMFNLVPRVLQLAKSHHNSLQNSLGGRCYQSGKPWRDPKTRYYASIRSYPQATYPGFCSGTGYVSTMNVAQKILQTSPNIPFFHLEDVYLALVLRNLGYKLTMYPGFAEGAAVCNSAYRAKKVMTIHEVKPEQIRRLWEKKCGA